MCWEGKDLTTSEQVVGGLPKAASENVEATTFDEAVAELPDADKHRDHVKGITRVLDVAFDAVRRALQARDKVLTSPQVVQTLLEKKLGEEEFVTLFEELRIGKGTFVLGRPITKGVIASVDLPTRCPSSGIGVYRVEAFLSKPGEGASVDIHIWGILGAS